MTILDVYLLGVVISFVLTCCKLFIEYKKNEQIVLSDIVAAISWIIFSWFTILMIIIYLLGEVWCWLENHADEIIIYKKKSKKK